MTNEYGDKHSLLRSQREMSLREQVLHEAFQVAIRLGSFTCVTTELRHAATRLGHSKLFILSHLPHNLYYR